MGDRAANRVPRIADSSTPISIASSCSISAVAAKARRLVGSSDNTTSHLVGDMEKLREFLQLGRWLLFGGSWGSTLSLAYAVSHAEHVAAMILRGVFLGSRAEVDWFLTGVRGFSRRPGRNSPKARADL
jgi:pimeloyl-ACP methyl ester carboxylesterase